MTMKDRLDAEPAVAWKPEPGDELIGKITELGNRTTEWGTYRIVTVKPDDGEPLAFHAYHTVAANQLKDASPAIGDEIGIRYLGKTESANSQYGSYQNYKIVVDHPEGWTPPSLEDAQGQSDRAVTEQTLARQVSAENDDIPF